MIVRRSGSLEDLNSTENATALLRGVTRGEHINTFSLLDLILHICPSCKYEHLCRMQMIALYLVCMGFDASQCSDNNLFCDHIEVEGVTSFIDSDCKKRSPKRESIFDYLRE